MRFQPIRPAPAGTIPLQLRGTKARRMVFATALAAAIGFSPAIMIASPAAAAPGDIAFVDSTVEVDEVAGGDNPPPVILTLRQKAGTAAAELKWSVVSGSATVGEDFEADFTASPADIDLADDPGADVDTTLEVDIIPDTVFEGPETFTVQARTDDVASTVVATATVTIIDSTNAPTIDMTVADEAVGEADGAVPVTLVLTPANGTSIKPGLAIPVRVFTTDGTAKMAAVGSVEKDYTMVDQTVTFAGSYAPRTVLVPITDDSLYEGAVAQDFTIDADSTNGDLADTALLDPGQITVEITDNEAKPKVMVTDPGESAEGTTIGFPVKLDHGSEQQITVDWVASGGLTAGRATSGVDYGTKNVVTEPGGTLTFAPGETAKTASVVTLEDALDEGPETFSVTLSGPTNADLGTQVVATGLIGDANAPTVTLSPKAVTEGNSGTTPQTFTVKLSKASTRAQTVHWAATAAAEPGSATKDVDFKEKSGDLAFAIGETEKTFTVDILGDTFDEGTGEPFTITLSNVSGSTVSSTTGDLKANTITITDDDDKPKVSVADVTLAEGNDGAAVALYTVKLSNPAAQTVTFDVTTAPGTDGTAVTGGTTVGSNDYTLATPTVTIPAGSTAGYALAIVNGDTVYEANETAQISVVPTGGTTAVESTKVDAKLTITNDDVAPVLTVTPVSGKEGETVDVKGVVTGVAQAATQLSVSFAGEAMDGSVAASANDFENPGLKSVTIAGGTASGTSVSLASFKLVDDTAVEPNETIVVSGTAFGNAATVKSGAVTIVDNDYAPVTLTVNSADGVEGTDVAVTGTVSGMSATDTKLMVSFAGGPFFGSDAAEPTDFVALGPVEVTVKANTAPGTVVPIATVKLTEDTVDEPDETILVTGTGAPGTGLFVGGFVNIKDNDEAPAAAPTLMAPPYRQGVGSLDLTGMAAANVSVELWAGPIYGGSLAKVDTTTSDAKGDYKFTRNFTTMGYRFQTKASGLTSEERKVWLRHDPVLVANSPTKGAAALKVTGDPKVGGLSVIFQWWNPATESWEKIGNPGVTSGSGLVIKTIAGLKSGTTFAFRGYVVGDESMGLQGGYSGTRRVTIK